ncbi:ENTH [Musa troglodytarum]|uniref:ENTH n=1 Tax=Musa troglodytarum TaxID=320322 RepID=A0A9E7JVY3_9LILI|nr:ENTH [Musa troglodytarum]
MAGVGYTQQSIRKALGALKDSTTVGLAKVNSDYKELDVAIVKATNHVEQLVKEKHIRTIFDAISASRPRADVTYCINALAKRLAKTHNWAVALKTLIVLHRALREVDPTFREELITYTKTRGFMLNLSHFKDDSSPSAWDYSSWVRTYALYLEERLECFRKLKYDIETERSRTSEAETIELLEHLPALQQLLFRLLGCQPEGAAMYNNVIRYALSIVASENVKIYSSINSGTVNLVDKFFEMPRHDAVRAIEIYKKTGNQAERLSEFYEICKGLEVGRGENFAKIEQPLASFIKAMEDYVKDDTFASQNKSVVNSESSTTSKPFLAMDHNSKDKQNEPEAIPTPPEPPATETTDAPLKTQTIDLLELDDFNHSAEEMEEKTSLALAIAADGDPLKSTSDETSGTSGWELALVGTPNSNENSVAQSKLAGGLDRLTLDSLYDDAFARTMNPSGGGGYHTGRVAPNPFDTSHYFQDPFYASNGIAPLAGVEMATMAQQQALMQLQQQALGQDGTNPFGNPFGPTGVLYAQDPSHNPYTGYM